MPLGHIICITPKANVFIACYAETLKNIRSASPVFKQVCNFHERRSQTERIIWMDDRWILVSVHFDQSAIL